MLTFTVSSAVYANPEGGQVVGGSATIESSGKKLDVHQHTDRAVIDWRSFDIQVDEYTQFHQPSSSATALNRVNSSDPSRIAGNLSANGNIILINPNGVFFEGTSQVDVNGLIATTADIDNQDFMAGNLHFNKPGNPDAAVVNAGTITAKEAGLVALVAPNVANHGVINARLGRVELASGDSVVADLYGDGLYELKVSDEVASQLVSNTGSINAEGGTIAITAAAGKEIVHSLVTIEGELKAPTIAKKGGKIIIAAAGSNAVAGNKAEDKGKKQGSSTVLIANAVLDVSGRDTYEDSMSESALSPPHGAGQKSGAGGKIIRGEQGGEIEITADNIGILQNTLIDASGHSPETYSPLEGESKSQGVAEGDWVGGHNTSQDSSVASSLLSATPQGMSSATMTADQQVRTEEEFLAHENRAGGSIKIGGDYLGKGDTAAASYVYVDPNSVILNDATHSGDAGRTIVWSDDTTQYYGNVFARGGTEGGNGGFLETSGKQYLDAQGYADLTAADGYKKGTYLLDPANITIYGNVDPEFVSTDGSIDLDSNLQLWLDADDASTVELTYSTDALGGATASGTSGTNTITTSADVSAQLEVGARIRLGAAGAVTTADTLGSDTYTITGIAGMTITVAETLTNTYAADTLYRGLVSQWGDKSAQATHATQTTDAERPLWSSDAQNGRGSLIFDGTSDIIEVATGFADNYPSDYSINAVAQSQNNGNILTAVGVLSYSSGSHDRNLSFAGGNIQNRVWSVETITSMNTYTGTNAHIFNTSVQRGSGQFLYANGSEVANGTKDHSDFSTLEGSHTPPAGFVIGGHIMSGYLNGKIPEVLMYNKSLGVQDRVVLEQYQSAKWGIALTPPGTGGTEAEQAMASDGYSAFTTRYLERLSNTADIVLQADNTITLDLKGDTLTLVDDRSISLQTTNGNISTASAGSIVTNRTGAGGDITFNAGGTGNINIDHALTLTAENGGEISFTAGGGNVNITDNFNLTTDNFNLTTDNFNLTTDNFNLTGTLNGTGTGTFTYQQGTAGNSLGVGTGGAPDITLSDALIADVKTAFSNYSFGRLDGGDVTNYTASWEDPVTFLTNGNFTNAADTTSDDTITITAGGDVILNEDIATSSATADAIQISAGGSFTNNAGSDALSASNANWVVYSNDPVNNQNNGLLPDESFFNQADIAATIASKTAGTNNIYGYNTATIPTITYDVEDDTVVEGNAYSSFSITYNAGLVGDDAIGAIGLTGTPSYNTTYTTSDAVGNYAGALTATTGNLASPLGYQFAFNAGDLTVTAPPPAGGGGSTPPPEPTTPVEPVTPSAPPTTNQNSDLPNTVVMTSQNPTVATTGTVSAANSTTGEENTETVSNEDNTDVNTSRSVKPKAKKALHGLVEIHPSLVRLFNLEGNEKLF